MTIARSAHFWHVCDSYGLAQMMLDLPSYLTTPNAWRSRPAYILGGAGVTAVLRPAALLMRSTLIEGRLTAQGYFDPDIFRNRFPAYFAMMAINFAVLAAALAMAMRLVDPGDGALAAALGAAIATSDMVHGMFWTQHSNFLNLIVPLGSITTFILGCRARQTAVTTIAGLGLVIGVLVLAYAYVAIWLSAYVLGALYRDITMRTGFGEVARGLVRIVIPLALAGCGPLLAWWAINTFYLHLPLSAEAETLRQFLWLVDAWRDDRLGAALAQHWDGYLSQAWSWLGFAAPVALAGMAVLAWLGRRQWPWAQAIRDPILVAVLVTAISMLSFNFLQGYYQPRLVTGIALALLVALARCAQMAGLPRGGALLLLGIAATQTVHSFLAPATALP